MKQDIESRNDIELLVNTFYNKVKSNKVIGYIFFDIAKVDWDKTTSISKWKKLIY